VAAIRSGELWCLTPAEIGRLTLAQVQYLFFRRRDKQGNIRRDPDKIPKDVDPRKEFIDKWRRWGLSRERAEERWREKRREEKTKKKKDKAPPRRIRRK